MCFLPDVGDSYTGVYAETYGERKYCEGCLIRLVVYLLEKLLPDYAPERLFDYTAEQLQWCKDNEKQMWDFLVENEYLFGTGQMLLRKFLFDAPFTSGMPAESPGKAVVWNGYRIIRSYMKKQDISMEALMKEQDYHKILRISGYKL